ncbi:MAG: AAA family ATPase [Chloroflexi bacterium]|nr:AAA family ATPase [Chloroflexota bacterium]
MAALILVVTDDLGLQRLLSTALEGEDRQVRIVSNGDQAMSVWLDRAPHLAVVDCNVGGLDAWTLLSTVRGLPDLPYVPVVLLGPDDAAAKVHGLRAGADDYQVQPVHPAELIARVRRLLVRFPPGGAVIVRPSHPQQQVEAAPQASTMGHVIALYGAKGGVGTTTLSINSAIALHRQLRRKVVLVDANLQFGDHRVFLDVGNDRYSIVDAVTSPGIDADLLANLVVHHDSGIDLLVAPTRPEEAEHVSADRHHMATIVETLRRMYDYVVVDLDKRLDDHSLDIISAADRMLVVMTADLSCIKNVRLVLETMTQIGVPDAAVELLLNRSNAYTGIGPRSIEAVLKRTISYQVVNDYRTAISALNSGEPFLQARPDSPIARSILDFVRAIDSNPLERRAATGQFLITSAS